MERLTESHIAYDPWELCSQDKYCKRGCHDEGGCTNGCPVPKLYWRLEQYERTGLSPERVQELAAAERDGRLVEFPCKVGDTIFRIDIDPAMPDSCVESCSVDGFVVRENNEVLVRGDGYDNVICEAQNIADKTPYLDYYLCFLTRAEAEAALAKMKEE